MRVTASLAKSAGGLGHLHPKLFHPSVDLKFARNRKPRKLGRRPEPIQPSFPPSLITGNRLKYARNRQPRKLGGGLDHLHPKFVHPNVDLKFARTGSLTSLTGDLSKLFNNVLNVLVCQFGGVSLSMQQDRRPAISALSPASQALQVA